MRTVILLLLLTSCTPSLYYVATDTSFEEINNQPFKRKIIYLTQEVGDLDRIDSMATILNKKKWKKFDDKINSFSGTDRQFLIAVKQLINEEYLASYRSLDSMHDTAYNCQVKLLKTDCLYEIGVDSVNFKSHYQTSMNCTQNEIIKSIINTRYRFLRYGQ